MKQHRRQNALFILATLVATLLAFLGAQKRLFAQENADPFQVALQQFESNNQALLVTISNARHLPTFKSHGRKTGVVFVVAHGLYGSPQYYKGISENLYASGNNVLSILLPGHWRADESEIKSVKFEEWQKSFADSVELASHLGDRIVLVGHSLGGLLSLDYASKAQSLRQNSVVHRIQALVLITPALRLTAATKNFAVIGKNLGLSLHAGSIPNYLSGDLRMFPRADGYDFSYGDLNPALQTIRGIETIFGKGEELRKSIYKGLRTPVMVVTVDDDPTVDAKEQYLFVDQLEVAKKHYTYGARDAKFLTVRHYTVGMDESDAFLSAPQLYNRDFRNLMAEVNRFLDASVQP